MRLSRFRSSVPIMADNREIRTIGSIGVRRNIRQVKKALYFSFSVLFTTFCRQTSIFRCVIMVDVFSHQGLLHVHNIHVSMRHTTMHTRRTSNHRIFRRNIYRLRSSPMHMMAPQFASVNSLRSDPPTSLLK